MALAFAAFFLITLGLIAFRYQVARERDIMTFINSGELPPSECESDDREIINTIIKEKGCPIMRVHKDFCGTTIELTWLEKD